MKRIAISLPYELMHEVEDYCKENHYTHSELIRHALRLLILKPYESISDRMPTQVVDHN